MSNELTEQEMAVLADILGDDETYQYQVQEYAVVSYRQGKLVAEGPYDYRHLAEQKAKDKGGVVAERVRTTSWGRWASLTEKG